MNQTESEQPLVATEMRAANRVRFMHKVFDYITCNNLTIAYEKSEDGESYRVGAAECSWKDNYSKAKGREIATQRLNENPVIVPNLLGNGPNWHKQEVGFIQQILGLRIFRVKLHEQIHLPAFRRKGYNAR